MVESRVVTSTLYFTDCAVCGCEIQLGSEYEKTTTCFACKVAKRIKKAKDGLAYLLGAVVVDVVPNDDCDPTIVSLTVMTTEGATIKFELNDAYAARDIAIEINHILEPST